MSFRFSIRSVIVISFLFIVVSIYYINISWGTADSDDAGLKLISHRGIHQTFSLEGVTEDSCTASHMDKPSHEFLENTLESIRAAFNVGASVVEVDVHPTTNGQFSVMHDWTLDCRTQGSGRTRDHSMQYLKTLDVGYGYTSDGGQTYPFRGKGIGKMPSLDEIFETFPNKKFLINFKSREAREADMLVDMITKNKNWRNNIWGVYGGHEPTFRAAQLLNHSVFAWSKSSIKKCLIGYAAIGWMGAIPDICKNNAVVLPINIAEWMWGWPNRLIERFDEVGSSVIIVGPFGGGTGGVGGIDNEELLARVPASFRGYVWTNKIEVIAPLITK